MDNDNDFFASGRKAAMTLYSNPLDIDSHRVRILVEEKDIIVSLVHVGDGDDVPEEVLQVNPYGSIPTLVDRDLAVYDGSILMEYLDERYPHPPMMPIDAVTRARMRMYMRQIQNEWYPLVRTIEHSSGDEKKKAQLELRERVLALKPVFSHSDYFLSDTYTILDMTIIPVLWRMKHLGIELPKHAKIIKDYVELVTARPAFINSLSEEEQVIEA